MKKIFAAGIVAGLVMMLVGTLVDKTFMYLFPFLVDEYKNAALFRPWSDPRMWLFFVQPYFLGIVLAWIWSKTRTDWRVISVFERGVLFGLVYWLLVLPGMLVTYASFAVSGIMVSNWILMAGFQAVCAGVVFSFMLKEGLKDKFNLQAKKINKK